MKTALTLQIIAHPSLSVDGWDTKLALWAELREEHEPRVITELSWIRESVQGEKQRRGLWPPCQHSPGILSLLLTLSDLNNQSECLHGEAKAPSHTSPGEIAISVTSL